MISIPIFRDLTAPQIANEIVKRGARGVWVMQALRASKKPVPGSTILQIFNYHDADPAQVTGLKCTIPIK